MSDKKSQEKVFLSPIAVIALVATLSAGCGDEAGQKAAKAASAANLQKATKTLGNHQASQNSCNDSHFN